MPPRRMSLAGLSILAGLTFAALARAQEAPAPVTSPATELTRFSAPEAKQGVAVDARHAYAISNSVIAKYDKATHARLGQWTGDPTRFAHMNSCEIIEASLVCANSNYPSTPMKSWVEIFDPAAMTHVRTIPLIGAPGSVTWIDRHDGAWWVGFANYDGRGGEPGRDHRATALVTYDDNWTQLQAWSFPEAVLARFAPYSNSGGGWGEDGLLYVTGHDRRELYALRVPSDTKVLQLVATVPLDVEGQAVTWDRFQPRVLWGVNRSSREVVAFRIPSVKELSK